MGLWVDVQILCCCSEVRQGVQAVGFRILGHSTPEASEKRSFLCLLRPLCRKECTAGDVEVRRSSKVVPCKSIHVRLCRDL